MDAEDLKTEIEVLKAESGIKRAKIRFGSAIEFVDLDFSSIDYGVF